MEASDSQQILSSLLESPGLIRVQGANTGAKAYILKKWLEQANSFSLLVVCSSEAESEILARDLECLKVTALRLPAWEQSPYSSINPSLKTRLQRVGTLGQIQSAQIIVASSIALCQTTIDPKLFHTFSFVLEMEESVGSREALVQKLIDGGYQRVDPVEDPGTFCVRGDIVDVFPPHLHHPIRIELFDDLVENVRPFNPRSQRTIANPVPMPLRIFPAREVLINSETQGRLRERVKAFADNRDIPRRVRDPVLESIQNGFYPDHSDTWAPFAYDLNCTFIDHLSEKFAFVLNDEAAINQESEQYLSDQCIQEEKLKNAPDQARLIVPGVEKLFQWGSGYEEKLKSRTKLNFDRIRFTDTEGDFYSIQIKENLDLRRAEEGKEKKLKEFFNLWNENQYKIHVFSSTQSQLERMQYLLREDGILNEIDYSVGTLSDGFRWPAEKLVFLTERDLLGKKSIRKSVSKKAFTEDDGSKNWAELQVLSDLKAEDTVVHIDHGIGIYRGLTRLKALGAENDFIQVEYAGKDKLYLPVYRLNTIQKYIGSKETIRLDKLGSSHFEKTKEKVKAAVKTLAINLVELYAKRELQKGVVFSPPDSEYRHFEDLFPFTETPDQLKAIYATLRDLQSGRLMDRLICGDVGFGKTEVAIRAAYLAVMNGKQVAVLVPTTILALQHEESFKQRLGDYPFIIESVSRFKSPREQKAVVERVASGKVDILIGTHRLLSSDVQFGDLGLIIVDEEHRFGVEHKEKLKALSINTHILTLTATPIPRTLHMALAGLREISIMVTPPVDRLPIRTYVSHYNDDSIKQAIEFEISRGGQVFFLHNRVDSIQKVASHLRELVPDARIEVGHGQMADRKLEPVMLGFYKKEFNVLVCTTIIESGLDIPSANTIIINRADKFGLAQLYQLRGRVGRSDQRAYCYLLVSTSGKMTGEARRRLEVIQRFVELGSGFNIASHDLEIRGGGNLLGPQQSGHIAAVGFDLYTELLQEAMTEIKGRPEQDHPPKREPEIKVPFSSFLDDKYIPDVHQRLSIYRRLSATQTNESLQIIEEELLDRYGPVPQEALNLLWIIRFKQLLSNTGIHAMTVGKEKISLVPHRESRLDPSKAVALMARRPRLLQITPESKLIVHLPCHSLSELYFALEEFMKSVCTST